MLTFAPCSAGNGDGGAGVVLSRSDAVNERVMMSPTLAYTVFVLSEAIESALSVGRVISTCTAFTDADEYPTLPAVSVAFAHT